MGILDSTLTPFFSPQGIAIVGASQNPTKLGFGLARNLLQSGYPGAVHFVNPRGGKLLERPIYQTISQVPDPVDLSVLLIPAQAVPDALKQCGQRGIQAAIVASGGFKEIGVHGAALEDECLRIAQSLGIRMIGPNCIGILDTHLPLDTTFLPPPGPPQGDVAFISHSGAICAAVIDWARGQGFGLSRLISLGNQADVNETDILAPVAADPHTKVITLYLEGISNGLRFVREASRVSMVKPILALKVGRFESGHKAVASHTGALAGQDSAFDAAFHRSGVIRATTSEELFDWARALAWCPLPKGPRVAVLTNAGGPGVTAVDALEEHHLKIAQLTDMTIRSLREILPPFASIENPVDMLASASPEHYAACLQLLLDDPGVDSVMVILPPPPMYSTGGVARTIIPIIYAANKPVIVALMGERMIQEAVEHFRSAHVPEYRFPERAAAALAVLSKRAEHKTLLGESLIKLSDVDSVKVHQLLGDYVDTLQVAGGSNSEIFLPQELLNQMMAAYKIPIPPSLLAQSSEDAVALAHQLGYPVALKVASPDIPHKSDVGGVLLNLNTAENVRQGFKQMYAQVKEVCPDADIEGVYVQPMILEGQEVIIGIVQDAQFGPVVMFGSGGVEVEGLKDVSFALAPLMKSEAIHLLNQTWAGKKLKGYRQIPPADETAVLDILFHLGQLAADFPQLSEIEINPLRVLPKGFGAFAVDVRAKLSVPNLVENMADY